MSLLEEVQVEGRMKSTETFDSVCWAEQDAMARRTTFPRHSILGSVRLTSVGASARTSGTRL